MRVTPPFPLSAGTTPTACPSSVRALQFLSSKFESYLVIDKTGILQFQLALVCRFWYGSTNLARVQVGKVERIPRELNTSAGSAFHEEGIGWS